MEIGVGTFGGAAALRAGAGVPAPGRPVDESDAGRWVCGGLGVPSVPGLERTASHPGGAAGGAALRRSGVRPAAGLPAGKAGNGGQSRAGCRDGAGAGADGELRRSRRAGAGPAAEESRDTGSLRHAGLDGGGGSGLPVLLRRKPVRGQPYVPQHGIRHSEKPAVLGRLDVPFARIHEVPEPLRRHGAGAGYRAVPAGRRISGPGHGGSGAHRADRRSVGKSGGGDRPHAER